MKSRVTLPIVWLTAIFVGPGSSATAGPLDPPPGPVESTGRFGPRIEISATITPGDGSSLFIITQLGSYHLGQNIQDQSGKTAAAHRGTLGLDSSPRDQPITRRSMRCILPQAQ